MAFHVACPITCERICFCTLGFPEPLRSEDGKKGFLDDVGKLEEFLMDPWFLRAGGRHTVEVLVPRIEGGNGRKVPASESMFVENGVGAGQSREEAPSLQLKRALMQRKAVEASLAAEYHARRLESGEFTMDVSSDAFGDRIGEDQNPNIIKVICRLCFCGESEGSERATRMISCKICNKKYHRSCLKNWAQHRDLFDWNSWVCPACRVCEVCRKAGDPTKFMFCKRCDAAYHSYCQHHPHKNVASGPYLCPNHTRCHSCGSNVPGNGSSTRWFLSYTCCDACGRLFVKEKYCPVCLKVYRDSESTPMVCCDVCERWVHSQCDGISDEKYLQYQSDSNLYYECASCRGDCYKVQDLDDAVRELWRRRDIMDRALIASLRAAAGLTEESISVSPYSDDEEFHATITKTDGKSLKFSLKGLSNSKEAGKESLKNSKSYKKHTKKKDMQTNTNEGIHTNDISESLTGLQSLENGKEPQNGDESSAERTERMVCFLPLGNIPAVSQQNHVGQLDAAYTSHFEEKPVKSENQGSEAIHNKYVRSHGLAYEEANQRFPIKTEISKGKRKLVIHLGSRNKNSNDTSKLETSSGQREHESAASMGSEETSLKVPNAKERNPPELPVQTIGFDDKKGAVFDASPIKYFMHRSKDDSLLKSSAEEVGIPNQYVGETTRDKNECHSVTKFTYGRRNSAENKIMPGSEATIMNEAILQRKRAREGNADGNSGNVSSPAPLPSSKPLLKLKIKTPSVENHSSWVSQGDDEKNFLKGQRSKRKRPSHITEKKLEMTDQRKNEPMHQDIPIDQETDARILKKLGKNAVGKRVEVHQASDNSWHKGVVVGTAQGRSALSVSLDDGRGTILEFGKQRVRFVSHKAKLAKP